MIDSLTIVTLVNNDTLYERFRRSIDRQDCTTRLAYLPIRADDLGWNAARALNQGIESARTEWVVLVHQDVVCPPAWLDRITDRLAELPPDTAVVGLVGIGPDGGFVGHIRDPHGHFRWLPLPAKAVTVDEHMILLRRASGLRFDPGNPGFHCYGADICLSARKQGFGCMVIDAPVVHLSGGRIDESFRRAANWLLCKWGPETHNVIPTCARLIYHAGATNLARLVRIRSRRRRSQDPHFCTCTCQATDVDEQLG